MASNLENVRLNVLMKLQEALDEEAILEEQILSLMHRFADRFTDRRVEINNLMVLHDHPLIDYGKYALGCMTGADMKKCVYLKSVRDELLRSMEEKRQLMTNYRDIKQMVAEKTSELERCLSELQDILIALEAAESRNAELTHAEFFSNSLQEALSQRDMILKKCAQIMAILINTPYYFKF
ncbi:hypothetical protein Tco_1475429 [Tanacetum coccineum]